MNRFHAAVTAGAAVAMLAGARRAGADDPAGSFVPTASLTDGGRDTHTATTLADGRVLVIGGYPAGHVGARATAESWSADSGTWSPAGTMATARVNHAAAVLGDGRVLVTGGQDGSPVFDSTEVWDPAGGGFSAGPSMSAPRMLHAAVTLADGRVLVAGGTSSSATDVALASAEVFDPATDTWSDTGPMTTGRNVFGMVLLADGRVFVAGGAKGAEGSFASIAGCEVYDPATGTFSPTAPMSTARAYPGVEALADGRVLVAGGSFGGVGTPHDAEVYDPVADLWTTVTGPTSSGGPTVTLTRLPDGRVLAAGGYDAGGGGVESGADLFDPATDTFAALPSMNAPRYEHTASLLFDGSVLLVGGAETLAGGGPYAGATAERFVLDSAPPADVTPPEIAAHGDVSANATSAAGAVVTFTAPAATDDVDGPVAVACAPASGTLFEVGVTEVVCTATDAAGNTATTTFDVIVRIDPEFLLGHVAQSLASLIPSSDRKTVKKLLKAVQDVEAGLASDLWTDAFHLSAKGRRAFKDDSAAVAALLEIESPDPLVLVAIEGLVDSDRVLAETAVADAHASVPTSAFLAQADAEIAAADSAAASLPHDAIVHYRKAWKFAMKAMGLL